MWNQKPSFRFEIDNFSEKEAAIASQIFVGGGCEWYLHVYPKGDSLCDDHLSLYLSVANRKSLRTGWKRSANYYFVVLNQSDKELYRSSIGQASTLFCAENPVWGFRNTLPLSKFQEEGFLEKDRLIIEVYIKIVEAFDGEGGDVSEKKETVDINGFIASQVTSVRKIFAEHVVKAEYKNVLSNACNKLSELVEVGFKLDWLKSKLDELSLKRKKVDDADESRVQQLEERIKYLELMESSFNVECFKSILEEVALKRKKAYDADGSRIQKLEERVNNLELMELDFKLDCLKSKLEEVSLEKKKPDDAEESRVVQYLEESVKSLELMVSDLKAEQDKEKAKSCADGFFLVDKVD